MRKLLALLVLCCLLPLGALAGEDVLYVEQFHGWDDLLRIIEECDAPIVDITVHPYTPEKLRSLMERFPNRTFRYGITAYNYRNIPWDTEVFDLGNKFLSLAETYAFVSLLPNLKELTLTGRPFTDEELTQFRADFPNLQTLHCRVRVSHYIVHTDATAFSTRHDPEHERHTNEDLIGLRHCRKLEALDLGHNAVTDLRFLENHPELKVLILVDNQITDVTPIAQLTQLKYLELFKNADLTDVSPLAACTDLIDLHFGHCNVSDISALYGLPVLERLWLPANPIPQQQVDHMRALHPDCVVNNTSVVRTTGEGWRANAPHYHRILQIFEKNRYLPFP